MNKRKALFFDIDGTLYDNSIKGIRKSSVDIIKQLYFQGDVDIYISTGRSILGLEHVKDIMPYIKGFNLVNGQHIIIDNNCIYTGFIDQEELSIFSNYCMERRFSIAMMSIENIYVKFYNIDNLSNFKLFISNPVLSIDDHNPLNDDILQIWLFASNEEVAQVMNKFSHLSIYPWGSFGADVVKPGGSKGNGVAMIIENQQYDFKNTYSFGDGDNDASMFDSTHTAVVMKKSSQLAREHANYFAMDISDEGLAKAIIDLGLLK